MLQRGGMTAAWPQQARHPPTLLYAPSISHCSSSTTWQAGNGAGCQRTAAKCSELQQSAASYVPSTVSVDSQMQEQQQQQRIVTVLP